LVILPSRRELLVPPWFRFLAVICDQDIHLCFAISQSSRYQLS
jgi:hypothetical protein